MSCQDQFARIVQKRGEGVPTEPASADHQNNDWLVTDVYQGEFYEDVYTGIVYYRNETGIEVFFDPSIGADQRFGVSGADDTVTEVRTITQSGIGTITFAAGGATPVPTVAGNGPVSWVLSGEAYKGITTSGKAIRGGASTGTGGYFASNSGAGSESESVSGVGAKVRGGAHIETYGVAGSKDASAVLHLQSVTQGFLPPKMTTAERNTIVSPATGLKVYDTTTLSEWSYNGTNWIEQ